LRGTRIDGGLAVGADGHFVPGSSADDQKVKKKVLTRGFFGVPARTDMSVPAV
jgi:hypothetical protein